MTIAATEQKVAVAERLDIVDCDIHPAVMAAPSELHPFMSARWREEFQSIGPRVAQPFLRQVPYPRLTPGNGMRGDAWPSSGGPPGSDLSLLQQQLLDTCGIANGILVPLIPNALNLGLGAEICAAVNQWQLEKWIASEPRLKGSICVTPDDPEAAIAEIRKHACNSAFVQILVTPRTIEPIGRKRYWPIFAVASELGLPIALHSDIGGKHANSGAGWFSYYWEDHVAYTFGMQTLVTSLIFEGAFERFPGLKIVTVEGGFAWAPSLGWRLDKHWRRMRKEVPHVTRPPSDYMRASIWYTTQPIEEPEQAKHLHDTIRWIGADRLLFSSDYPHWDFDDPRYAFKIKLSRADEAAIFAGNARDLYRLDK